MAHATYIRRYVALSIQSIPGPSTRARVPRYFAAPQSRWLWTRPSALFRTLSTLGSANDASPEAPDHTYTTGDATTPKEENSDAAATGNDFVEPHHENTSSQTEAQSDMDPGLSELQEDLEMDKDFDQSEPVDKKLSQLTGRRPGKPSSRVGSEETTKEPVDVHHMKEDLIAQLVMGKIKEEEASQKLKQLEFQKAPGVPRGKMAKSGQEKRKGPVVHDRRVNREDRTSKPLVVSLKSDRAAQGKKEGGNSAFGKRKGAREREEVEKPEWLKYKETLERKFEGASWRPAKRVSPDTVLGIRDLHKSDPNAYNIEILADQFKISKEAVRRILKSKFTPNPEEMKDKRDRWHKRGERVWQKLSDTGVRPPKKWREMGVSQGPAPWKKGTGQRRPKEAGYAWDEDESEGSGEKRISFVGRIE